MQQRGAGTAPERAQERDTPKGVSSAPRAPARTRGTTTLEQLADSARTPGAWNLVNTWRLEQSAPYRTATVRALSKQVEAILADKGDPDTIRDALDAWAARSDAGPGLLPNLYDDALKARHGARPGGRTTRDDKVAGWHALADDPNAAVGHSARGDKAAGWLALADEPTTDTPNLTALPGGAA